MKKFNFFVICMFFSFNCLAQVGVNYVSASQATNILSGQGVTVFNASFTGAGQQLGSFNNGSNHINISSGILLSSNDAKFAQISNNSDPGQTSASNCSGTPWHDPDLALLANKPLTSMRCPAILEFDFTTTGTEVSFEYVFASEEYFNYSPKPAGNCNPSPYNDVFGFFISGPGINGPYSNNSRNIALVPNTNIPVSVNTVNLCNFSNYIVNNCFGNSCFATGFPAFDSQHLIFPFNAFTTVLPAKATVSCVPGNVYHLKIAVSNSTDDLLDAAVFLKAGSLKSDFVVGNITANPNTICLGQPLSLSVQGDNSWTYTWSDGQTGVGLKNITTIPVNSGLNNYSVTVTNTNGCQITQNVTVNVHTNNNIAPYINGINNSGEYTYFAHDGTNISFSIPSFDDVNEEVVMTLLNQMPGSLNFTTAGFQNIGSISWQVPQGAYGIYDLYIKVCDKNTCLELCNDYIIKIIITCPQCPIDVFYENRSQQTIPLPAETFAPRLIAAGQSVDPNQTDGPVIVGVGENVLFEAGVLIDLQPGFTVNGGVFTAQIVPGTCIDKCDDCCIGWYGFTYNFIPNVFSPNGDGVNDIWYVPDTYNANCAYNANGYNLTIYNRWGCPVYIDNKTYTYCCPFNSGDIKWNGIANTSCIYSWIEILLGHQNSYNGQYVSNGVYYYVLKFIMNMSTDNSCYYEHTETGEITILGSPSGMPLYNQNQAYSGSVVSSFEGQYNDVLKTEYDSFFNVYPNPFSESIQIEISNEYLDDLNAALVVYDISGKVILEENLQTNHKTINFGNIAKGIYVIKLQTTNKQEYKKIIKN